MLVELDDLVEHIRDLPGYPAPLVGQPNREVPLADRSKDCEQPRDVEVGIRIN